MESRVLFLAKAEPNLKPTTNLQLARSRMATLPPPKLRLDKLVE